MLIFFQFWAQLTLAQYRFELHRSTYVWIFVNKYLYCCLVRGWESENKEGQLYTLIYIIYIEDLSILRICYLKGILEPIPWEDQETVGVVKFSGSQVICQFGGASVPLIFMLLKGQLYILKYTYFINLVLIRQWNIPGFW